MNKVLGVFALLLVVCLLTGVANPDFLGGGNIRNNIQWISLRSVLAIGAAMVIITGGIDLSIGSVVGLTGCTLSMLVVRGGWNVPLALVTVLALSAAIGAMHGLLITKVRLQPFIVTLCGLLIYRGVARWMTGDATQGYSDVRFEPLRRLIKYNIPLVQDFRLPMPFLITCALAVAAAVFLNRTIYGRYLLALGRNEQAARYSGIDTHRMTILAYLMASFCAGLGGVLFSLDVGSVQPSSHGEAYELYAIAAAVLGGCSLRGGEGSILGVLVGTALMQVLNNATTMLGISDTLEYATIGVVILLAVLVDEAVKRVSARRRMAARG